MVNTLVNRIIDLSFDKPTKRAVAFKNESLTYKELIYRAAGMCRVLKEHGIKKGDKDR